MPLLAEPDWPAIGLATLSKQRFLFCFSCFCLDLFVFNTFSCAMSIGDSSPALPRQNFVQYALRAGLCVVSIVCFLFVSPA